MYDVRGLKEDYAVKNLDECLLLDFYGNLLTDKMRDATDLYLNDDLTFAEIADTIGISRQGVHDTVKRALKQLHEYEDKLGLVERFTSQSAIIDEAIGLIDSNDAEGARALLTALKTEIEE